MFSLSSKSTTNESGLTVNSQNPLLLVLRTRLKFVDYLQTMILGHLGHLQKVQKHVFVDNTTNMLKTQYKYMLFLFEMSSSSWG